MIRTRSVVTLLALVGLVVPGLASAGTVSGSVDLADGTAVEGALVVVMDRNGTTADPKDDTAAGVDVTDANGDFSITTEGSVGNTETVDVVSHDAGTAPVSTAVTLSGGVGTVTITPTPSGTTFAALDIFGGQVSRVLPGGDPCEFYLSTSVIPQIFVTTDCAGTWTPVTTQTDSTTSGLSGDFAINGEQMATSGVGGEVAALVNGRVQYSRDYGVTWKTVGGTALTGDSNSRQLFWGHVGANDVILVRAGTNTYTADLQAATPTLVDMTTDYVASQYDGITVANGDTAPYVAVAAEAASGTVAVTVRPLTAATTPATASTTASVSGGTGGGGAPNWVSGRKVQIAFGGAARTGWPNVLVVTVLATGNDVVKILSDTNNDGNLGTAEVVSSSLNCSDPTPGAAAPAMGIGRTVDPRAGGISADVGPIIVGSCYLRIDVGGTQLDDQGSGGSDGGNNAAIDPGWGTAAYQAGITSRVLIAPQGDRGVFKASSIVGTLGFGTNTVPIWPSLPATDGGAAGTAATSDGFTVNGLSVPVVKDMAFGPAGATDVAVMFSTSGGGLCLASDDGLATQARSKPIVLKGGNSVAWWTGTSGNVWLLCGHSGAGNILSAFNNWTPSVATANAPNVASSSSTQHGIDTISAIEGVTGTNTVWFGGSRSGATADGKLIRAVLSGATGSVALSSIVQINADDPVTDLEYCPAGSASGFADVLFLSTQDGANGGVYRISSASTATGSATPTLLTGSRTNGASGVEVDCAAGVLWAGLRGSSGGGASIQKSTDGTTLAAVATPGINVNNGVTAIAINPSNANELLFASDQDGFVYATLDGGTTWVTVNNARQFPGGVNFNSEGIAAMALPPGLTRTAVVRGGAFHERAARAQALSSSSTALGSGGGAYRATFRSTLTVPPSGGSGSGGTGSGGSGAGGSGAGGSGAAPVAAVRATLAIAGAKWDAKKKGIVATVTASAAGRVTLTVNLKQGAKLKKVASGAAVVKAGANASVLFTMKKPPKGSYALVAAHANGATAAGAIRVK